MISRVKKLRSPAIQLKNNQSSYIFRLIGMLITFALLASCSAPIPAKDEGSITPHSVRELLTSYDSYSIDSTWLFTCPDMPTTRLSGRAWIDTHGKNYIYANSFMGVTTLLLVIDGKLSAPFDSTPLTTSTLSSNQAKKRISTDMFAYDPLSIASSYPLKLHFTSQGYGLNFKRPKLVSQGPIIPFDHQTQPNLLIDFDNLGFIKSITFSRPLGSPGCKEKINYNLHKINKTSVKNIAQNIGL